MKTISEFKSWVRTESRACIADELVLSGSPMRGMPKRDWSVSWIVTMQIRVLFDAPHIHVRDRATRQVCCAHVFELHVN